MKQNTEAGSIQRHTGTPGAYVGDALLMMSVVQGRYFSLNAVASRIWELLEHPTTPEKIISSLLSEYDISPDVCATEVAGFLTVLREHHLLVEQQPQCA
jgi:hypothetical protein